MSDRAVVLYHRGCFDGAAAAHWVGGNLGHQSVTYVAMDWHHEPPLGLCEGADVWSVDWCPDAEWMAALHPLCATLTVLDHHQSSLNEIEALGPSYGVPASIFDKVGDYCDAAELDVLNRVSIVLDQDRSGAGLAGVVIRRWKGIDPPRWIAHVEDRDLWRFELTDTPAVVSYLATYPAVPESFNEIETTDWDLIVAEGRGIERYRHQLVERVASSFVWVALRELRSPMVDQEQWVVPCAVSPYMIGSDVAGRLAETVEHSGGIGAYVILHPSHVQFGLRSRGDGPDVAKIAEHYGGGGHAHASGFTVDYATFAAMICPE